ncbi:MAG: KAP family NTPase [Hyphomonadaceae bacterium]|nr:KAP family NTPase [Hyphomonadaceae bacterium]
MSNRWTNDVLNRKALAERLVPIIKNHHAGAVIGIEGEFGSGKTYFLTNLQAHLQEAGLGCVYFNAWESDFVEQPLVVLLEDLVVDLNKRKPEAATLERMKAATKRLLPVVARISAKAILRAGSEEWDRLLGPIDEEVDSLFRAGDSQKLGRRELAKARSALTDLVDAAKSESPESFPLVVLVDELDRSNPTWAATFLESVKHLLAIPGIVFVVAIDRKNLVCLLKHQFGAGYDVEEYLAKFFNYWIGIQNPSADKRYLIEKLKGQGLVADGILAEDGSYVDCVDAAATACLIALGGSSGRLRRLERCAERLSLCLRAATSRGWAALFGCLVGLEASDRELFRGFVGGLRSGDLAKKFWSLDRSPEQRQMRLLAWLIACTISSQNWEQRRQEFRVWLGEDAANAIESARISPTFFYFGSATSPIDSAMEQVGWVLNCET